MTAEISGDIQIVISVISGLFGGAAGGVATAGAIARRGAKAQDRYAATSAIRGVLNTYRARLVFDHDELYAVSHFSDSYASIWGQEELAKSIVVQLPLLAKRNRRAIREGLLNFVGALPLEFAEARAHIPDAVLDVEAEKARQAHELIKALHVDDTTGGGGLLSKLLATQNRPEAHSALYEKVLAEIDKLLLLVRP